MNVAIEMRSPTRRFISVDFPTFGLPTILTKPDLNILAKLIPFFAGHEPFLIELCRLFGCFLGPIITPNHVARTPSEACAKSGEDELVAFLELRLILPKTKGKRAATGVGHVVDVDHDVVFVDTDALCNGNLNVDVGLMLA